MAKGGYRSGAGRPKGAKDSIPRKAYEKSQSQLNKKTLEKMLTLGLEAKTILYQEFIDRVKDGDKLSLVEKKMMEGLGNSLVEELDANKAKSEPGNLGADEFLKGVWNNPAVDIALRIRAAEVVFRNTTDAKGKKELKEEKAQSASDGKFKAGRAPIALVK